MKSEILVDLQPSFLAVDFSQILDYQACVEMRQIIVLIQSYWLDQNNNISIQVNYSSGLLISNLILTAAHNIYSSKYQKFANRIELSFLNQENQKEIKKNADKLVVNLNRSNFRCNTVVKMGKQIYEKDIALIKIQNHRQIKSSNFISPIKPIDYLNKGQKIFAYGFPNFKSPQSQGFKKKKQDQITNQSYTILKQDIGTFSKITNDQIYYRIQTVVGQSGCPLFVLDEKQNKFVLVGIHSSYRDKDEKGKGVFMSNYVYTMIQKWAEQLKCQLPKYQIIKKQTKKSITSELQMLKSSFTHATTQFKTIFKQNTGQIIQYYDYYKRILDDFTHEIQSFQMELNCLISQYEPKRQDEQDTDSVEVADELNLGWLEGLQQEQEQQQDNNNLPKALKRKEQDSQNSQSMFLEITTIESEEEENVQHNLHCPHHANQQFFYKYYQDDAGQYKKVCNRCVFYDKDQKQNILCLRHNKVIQFITVNNSGEGELFADQPTYLCELCPKNINTLNYHYKRIDCLHHQPVKYIKINFNQYKSTKKYANQNETFFRQFLLCDKCNTKDAVLISEGELQNMMDHQGLQHQNRILSYLKSIQGLIRLKQFEKVKNYYIYHSKSIFNFFEAIEDSVLCKSKTIYDALTDHNSSNEQIDKIVQKLNYMQKYKVKEKTSQQIMKLVQFYKDFIENQTYHEFIKISGGLQRLKETIQYQFDHKSGIQRIEQSIKSKYYRIVNKVKHSELITKPCLLIQVLPAYYSNVFQIFIVKEFEDQEEVALKTQQLAYCEDQWTSYYKSNKFTKEEKLNWNVLSKQTNFYKQQERLLEKQIKFKNRKNQKKAIILQKIYNFPNLTKLTVIYDHFKCNYEDFDYEIQSIDLIEMLLKKEKLKMVQLYGIKINHMTQLINELYIHRAQYEHVISFISSNKITLHLKAKVEIASINHFIAFAFFASLFQKLINFTLSFTTQQLQFELSQLDPNFISCQEFYGQQLQIRNQMIQRLKTMNQTIKLTNTALNPNFSFRQPAKRTAKNIIIDCLSMLQRTNIESSGQSFCNIMNEIVAEKYQNIKNINTLTFSNMTITNQMRQNINYLLNNNIVTYLTFKNCIHEQHVVKSIKNSIIAIEYTNCSMATSELNQMLKSKSQMIQLKLENLSLEDKKQETQPIPQNAEIIKFDYLRRIVNLHLINCEWLTDQVMAKLPRKCFKNIQILKLAQCRKLTSRVIYNTVSNFERLNTLDICSTNIEVSSLLSLRTAELSHLQIACNSVNQQTLSLIDKKWPTIFILNIYRCPKLTDKIFEVCFKHLQKLYLQRSKISFYKLRQLRLRGVQILSSYQVGIDLYPI